MAWPKKDPYQSSLEPQQMAEPSVLTPQLWIVPVLTEANGPKLAPLRAVSGVGVGWSGVLVFPNLSSPQHSTVPSFLTPQV